MPHLKVIKTLISPSYSITNIATKLQQFVTDNTEKNGGLPPPFNSLISKLLSLSRFFNREVGYCLLKCLGNITKTVSRFRNGFHVLVKLRKGSGCLLR